MTVLIVGAGPMAAAHAKALSVLGTSFQVLGRGEESAKRFEAEHGIQVRMGGVDAISDSEAKNFSAAVVAVNIESLSSVTRTLSQKGIRRFLIEKPAGVDADEIRMLESELRLAKTDAFVAYNRRFYASTEAAKRMIKQDGGVTSFHFEFTEIESRILATPRPKEVLENFTLGNSSHVVDLAFFLGGSPVETAGLTAGGLSWHPQAAVFAGCGKTNGGALFTWRADWSSAGRWSVDLRTPKRRLLMEPMEGLSVQEKGSFQVQVIDLDDAEDKLCKPGVLAQMRAFLSSDPCGSALPSLTDHVKALDNWFIPVFVPHKTNG